MTFVSGELVKLVLVERLFNLTRDKLLRIPAFAWAYRNHQAARAWLEATEAWQIIRWMGRSVLGHLANWRDKGIPELFPATGPLINPTNAHHAHRLPAPIEVRPHVRDALAASSAHNRGLAQTKRDTNCYLRFGGDFGGAGGGDRSTGANCCVSQASMITDWRVPL